MKRIVSNSTYHSINLYTDLLLAECEVRTASLDRVFFFLLWPKREARGPWKQGRKKRGSITCLTDRANETNKMFIIWLCWLFRFWIGDRKLEVRTATYGPGIDQSQHAKSVSHIIKQLIHRSNFGIPCAVHCLISLWVDPVNFISLKNIILVISLKTRVYFKTSSFKTERAWPMLNKWGTMYKRFRHTVRGQGRSAVGLVSPCSIDIVSTVVKEPPHLSIRVG